MTQEPTPRPSSDRRPAPLGPGVGAFAMVSILTVVLGAVVFVQHRDAARHAVEAELSGHVNVRARWVERWLREREGDLKAFADQDVLQALVAEGAGAEATSRIELRLTGAATAMLGADSESTRVLIFDGKSRQLWRSDPGGPPPPAALDGAWRASLTDGRMSLIDPFTTAGGDLALGLVLGQRVSAADGRLIDVGVYLEIDPRRSVFPVVSEWKTAHPSAESMLVRMDGDAVVLMTPSRRYGADRPQGSVRLSLLDPPAQAEAVPRDHTTRVTHSEDEAGVEVLRATTAVAGTSWIVVAKVDEDEVDRPLERFGFTLLTLVFVMFGTTGLGLLQLRRVLRLEGENAVYRARQAQQSVRARYLAALEVSPDGYFVAGPHGVIEEVNRAFTSLTGYADAEARALPWRHFEADPNLVQALRATEALAARGFVRFESMWRRKDGAEIAVEVSAARSLAHPDLMFGFVRDITEAKARIRELAKVNTLFAFASRANGMVARAEDEGSLFRAICQIAVEVGEARLAWIGRPDPTGRVQVLAGAGPAIGYVEGLHVTNRPGDPASGGPAGRALREDMHVVFADFTGEAKHEPWREAAIRHGLCSVGAFPLSPRSAARAVMVLYFADQGRLTPEVVALLDDLARDIAFALEAFETHARAVDAEQRVVQTTATLRHLSAQLPGLVYQFKRFPDGRMGVPFASEGIERVFGVTAEEVVADATKIFERILPDDVVRVAASIEHSYQTLCTWRDEFRVALPEAGQRWLRGEAAPERLEGGSVLWHGYIADVTEERRLAGRLRGYLDASPLPIHVIRRTDQRTTYLNASHQRLFGYEPVELESAEDWFARAFPSPAFRDRLRALWMKQVRTLTAESGPIASPDLRIQCGDGSTLWAQGIATAVGDELIVVWVDLTARRAAEEATTREVARTKALLHILEVDDDQGGEARVRTALEEIKTLTGASAAFLYYVEEESLRLGGSTHLDPDGPADRSAASLILPRGELGSWASGLAEDAHHICEGSELGQCQHGLPDPLRAQRRMLVLPTFDGSGRGLLIGAVDKAVAFGPLDVESIRLVGAELLSSIQRSKAVRDLKASEGRFRGLVEQAVMGIFVVEFGRITYANARLAELFGRPLSEILGRKTEDFIVEADHPVIANVRLEQVGGVRAHSLTLRVLRPDGSLIDVAVSTVVSMQGEWPITIVLAEDVTERKRAQEAIAQYAIELELMMKGTVLAMSKVVDLRDPYTSGHERRVAALAAALAAELGWSADRVRGMEIIGSIHDIGQISVPAEILTRPARLTPLERRMVETHAEAGRDVLKNIQTHWPLAEAVWQHHERLDGSGYPRKLKGAEIIPEARVIAVADVIEALCSHRPYRPARGLEAALEEVEQYAGERYDGEVVAAAARLFREKGFVIPD